MSNETKEVVVYSCGYCGQLFREKSAADECHADRACATCGIVIGKKNYYTKCESCMAKEKKDKENTAFEKATKMTYKEYVEKFPGYATCEEDNYFWCFEDIECHFDDCEMPKYVWATEKTIVTLDCDNIIQAFEEECELENFEVCDSGVKRLKDFLDLWNYDYGQEVYFPSNKIAVLL